jgi:peptidoglycan-associated lipoprotein
MKLHSALFLASVALIGCKKRPVDEVTAGVQLTTPTTAVLQDAKLPGVPDSVVAEMKANFQRVHFAYDSAYLDATSRDALKANVAIMRSYPNLQVEVQGHADERGTVEYNLGLGERRAFAVRDLMLAEGVAPSRVRTVSFGEERPLANGADDRAWSQNRRAEFRMLSGAAGVAGTVQ